MGETRQTVVLRILYSDGRDINTLTIELGESIVELVSIVSVYFPHHVPQSALRFLKEVQYYVGRFIFALHRYTFENLL